LSGFVSSQQFVTQQIKNVSSNLTRQS